MVPLGAAPTDSSVILLKLSLCSLHSGCISSISFLLAANLTLIALETFQCPVLCTVRQTKALDSCSSKHTAVHFFSFSFVVTHKNKLPKLETDIEQWLSSSSRKIQNICKKIFLFWQRNLLYDFNPHLIHTRIYCCEWNNHCLEILDQFKNDECFSFPKM